MDKLSLASAIEGAVESVTRGNTKLRAELAEAASISESGIRAMFNARAPSALSLHRLLVAVGRQIVLGDPNGEPLVVEAKRPRRRKAG